MFLTKLAISPQRLERSNLKIKKKKLPFFLFLVKLCVDTRACDKYKMLCDDLDIDSNEQMKNFLEEGCPNTCGYCSKFILDIRARLTQMNGSLLLLLLLLFKKRTKSSHCHLVILSSRHLVISSSRFMCVT